MRYAIHRWGSYVIHIEAMTRGRSLCGGKVRQVIADVSTPPHEFTAGGALSTVCPKCLVAWRRQTLDGFSIERTESHVQCECVVQPCRHAPDFYKVVVEWGAWDEGGNMLGTFATKREATDFALSHATAPSGSSGPSDA